MNRQEFADQMARHAGGTMGVQTRNDKAGLKGLGQWHTYTPGLTPTHSLREQGQSEIVFDIGDHGDWQLCVAESHALWRALNAMGIPYWAALSGGKGTHTHVFGPKRNGKPVAFCANCNHVPHPGESCDFSFEPEFPGRCSCRFFEARVEDDDWRKSVSGQILEVANAILGNPLHQDLCDHRLLAPTRHVQREFGERQLPLSPTVKTLWHVGPGAFLPLPSTREAAYAAAKQVYPNGPVPVAEWLARMDRRTYSSIAGGRCLTGPGCIKGFPGATLGPWGMCESCPLVN
jgi:hypothetical protein